MAEAWIHQGWVPNATTIEAAVAQAIADALRLTLTPGLDPTADATLGQPDDEPVDGLVVMAAFSNGAFLVSGGALCFDWYDDQFDFATANGGSPMPNGTYKLYVRVMPDGSPTKRFKAYVVATDESGDYDVDDPGEADAWRTGKVNFDNENTYLVLYTGVEWEEGALNDSSEWTDVRPWGVLDLARLGVGVKGNVILDETRPMAFAAALVEDLEVTNLDAGSIEADDIAVGGTITIAKGLGNALILEGDETIGAGIVVGGNGVIYLAEAYAEISLAADTDINLSSGAAINLASGALTALGSGAQLTKAVGGKILLYDEEFSGTPDKYGLYGAQLPRMICECDSDGNVTSGFNVESVDKSELVDGSYTVFFKRDLAATTNAMVVATPAGTALNRAAYATLGTSGGRVVVNVQTASGAGDGNEAASDLGFNLVVYGGTLAAD